MAIEIKQNTEASRFELWLDDHLQGISEYHIVGNQIIFTHTQVDHSDREHGLGSTLVKSALDTVRNDTGYRLVPQCPFVAHYLKEHPEYGDLLTR